MTLHLRPSSGEDATEASFREKPDAAVDPAGETGWFLQRERERRGKSLADAALETRINAKYLNAIEHGLLGELPNRSYILGYIRVYSEFLDLEADPLVEHYKGLLPAQGNTGARAGHGMSSLLGLTAVTVVFIIGLTAAVWYVAPHVLGSRTQETAATAPSDPDELATGSIPPTRDAADVEAQRLDDALPTVRVKQRGFSDTDNQAAVDQSTDSLQPADKTPVTETTASGDEETDGLTEFIRQHVNETQTSKAPDEKLPGGKVYGTENNSARIVLTAKQPVWIRIEDSSGEVMITRTLAIGDTYRVPDRKGLVLIARDGGALDYSIDGRVKGAIGASGEIVVGRSLDIDKLNKAGG